MSLKSEIVTESPRKAVRLTQRESEVLSCIAQGHTSSEVADALFVSKRTIDFHLANTFEKLGVVNRVQAIIMAGRLGLIPVEPEFALFRNFRRAAERSGDRRRFAPGRQAQIASQ